MLPPTLADIRALVENACQRAGRPTDEVTLIGASKKVAADRLEPFLVAGLNDFGENYIQEGLHKIADFKAQGLKANWHFIGSLQSNKARDAVRHFDLIHSVDRLSLAEALHKEAAKQNKIQPVLLQVNLAGEGSKAGCLPEAAEELLGQILQLPNLNCQGLMSLPPYLEDAEQMRPYHAHLRELRNALFNRYSLPQESFHYLSMGMSNDFEVAIEEGATHVRVGTRLFGARE